MIVQFIIPADNVLRNYTEKTKDTGGSLEPVLTNQVLCWLRPQLPKQLVLGLGCNASSQ